MTSKLHINLQEGRIEVDGSEEFVREIYQDFKESFTKQSLMLIQAKSSVQKTSALKSIPQNTDHEVANVNEKILKAKIPKQAKNKAKGGGAYQVLDIDLGELETFYNSYKIQSSKV